MIHISRLVGETLMIGDEISVTVLAVEGDEVLLEINSSDGIDAVLSEVPAACLAGVD